MITIETSLGCEKKCSCQESEHPLKLIVVTGGPGAGKTAMLELIRKILCSHVIILPEAASILFKGGFWRLNSVTAIKAAQRAIFHVQDELEKLVIAEKRWALGLCDRGTLDGLAYWPGSESEFYSSLKITKEEEYKKYLAVIHLRTPNKENGYNHQNPMRIETPQEAAKIDLRIKEIWQNHQNYLEVPSAQDFITKVHSASEKIRNFIPSCCMKKN